MHSHFPYSADKEAFAEFLIDNHADLEIRNKEGKTVLYSACEANPPDLNMIDMLIDNGAVTNAKDNEGLTPIEAAKRRRASFFVEILKSKGL